VSSGLVLIAIGLLWLLRNLGILPGDVFRLIMPWWPLLLVFLGLKAIFLPRRSTSIGALLLALVLLGVGYLGIFPAEQGVSGPWVTTTVPIPIGASLPREVPHVVLNANIAASSFYLRAGDPAMPYLAKTRSRGLPLHQTIGAWGAQNEVIGLSHLSQGLHRSNLGQLGSQVVTELNPKQAFALEILVSAAAADLDLRGLNLTEVKLRLDAGQATLHLPDQLQQLAIAVEANAADVKLVIPENVAARIRVDSEVAMVVVDESRFQRQGEFFVSREYDQSARRILVSVDLAVGRLRIE